MAREIHLCLVYRDMWQSSGKYVPRVDQLKRVAGPIIDMGCFRRVETNGGGFEQINLLFGENPNRSVREWTQAFNDAGIQTQMLERGLNGIRMSPVPADIRRLMFRVKKQQGTDIAREVYSTFNGGRAGKFVQDDDVTRMMLPRHGDYRMVAARSQVPNSVFGKLSSFGGNTPHSNTLTSGLIWGVPGYQQNQARIPTGSLSLSDITTAAERPANVNTPETYGDWDMGVGHYANGPYINKPDEGSGDAPGSDPYFHSNDGPISNINFSPNRQIASPVMFGSLPTGVQRGIPWQNLLFRPDHTGNHPGADTPPDHLLLDLFWMPVVQPYAISEPFSTAGKINLNYRLAPFSYITRQTGMWAALQSERSIALPNGTAKKNWGSQGSGGRKIIDTVRTLQQFEDKFDSDEIFKSTGEITQLHMVPVGESASNMGSGGTFWNSHQDTGDNARERVYNGLYSRLTTKSNTFRVHYRVQYLKQTKRATVNDTAWNKWFEDTDQVLAEQRGSYLIERYIDPNDDRLTDAAEAGVTDIDFTTNPDLNLEDFYQFRIISHKKFAP